MRNGKVNKIHTVSISEGDAVIIEVNGQPSVVIVNTDVYNGDYAFTAGGITIKNDSNIYGQSTLGSLGTCGSVRSDSEHPQLAAMEVAVHVAKTWSNFPRANTPAE